MRKTIFNVTCVVIVLFGMFGCDSELDLDKTLNFSKLTVEEQKQKIEQNGIELIETLENVKTTQIYKTLKDFMSESGMMAVPQLKFIKLAIESKDVTALNTLDRQLRVAADEDEIWGEYVWNTAIQDFEKTANLTNKLIAKFPASKTDNTNGAELTINYAESNVKVPDSEDYYPSSISCVIKVNGSKVFNADFSGEYKSDGTPIKADHLMEMDDFKWTASMKNTTTEFSEDYEFKHKSKTLVKSTATVKGNLTADIIDNADDPTDIFTFASVYFQIMDLAVLGGMKDVKTFVDEMNALTYSDTKAHYQNQCNIINKHLVTYGYYVKDKAKFADIEFYVYERTNEWSNWNWDGSAWVETKTQETYFEPTPRFILSDGSKVGIGDYIRTGFDGLLEKMEEFVSAFN